MTVLTLYFRTPDNGVCMRKVAVSSWYCKPAILQSLAFRLGCVFICCEKYGHRQFCPCMSCSFPVYNVDYKPYKVNLSWLVIEFNSYALTGRYKESIVEPSEFMDYVKI